MKTEWPDKDVLNAYKLATGDNPWSKLRDAGERRGIADEMRKVVAAKNIKEAVALIEWWCNGEEETLDTARKIRKAYKEWRKAHG